MDRGQILRWLREQDQARLDELWNMADHVRRQKVGNEVHLRGLIEVSNICSRGCLYCNLNASNKSIERYRLSEEEIIECGNSAKKYGYNTLVLQSGEDKSIDPEWVSRIIRKLKEIGNFAITLSLGEWDQGVYKLWRDAGADRYLLRFETSDRELFDKIHPGSKVHRIELLEILKKLDYEVGSGVMVGIPGQSYESLADDIELFRTLDLHMIGLGPYVPDENTILGKNAAELMLSDQQVPADEITTYKAYALARIICPETNIPATTALATLNPVDGYEKALSRGANVVMPNVSPKKFRKLYSIYPKKVCVNECDSFHEEIHNRIKAIGRTVGQGRGSSVKYLKKHQENYV